MDTKERIEFIKEKFNLENHQEVLHLNSTAPVWKSSEKCFP